MWYRSSRNASTSSIATWLAKSLMCHPIPNVAHLLPGCMVERRPHVPGARWSLHPSSWWVMPRCQFTVLSVPPQLHNNSLSCFPLNCSWGGWFCLVAVTWAGLELTAILPRPPKCAYLSHGHAHSWLLFPQVACVIFPWLTSLSVSDKRQTPWEGPVHH